MLGFLVVFCTCGSEEEALRLAHALVENRLAACVNILPPIQSVYRWKGEVQSAEEYLLLIKTTEERFDALHNTITDLHSYDTPEVIGLPVTDGSEKYLAWLRQSV
ncbi:MAG: divalent-cation tolerance protein CutA [Acidobacteriaceae bacterium]|nr:divalent-cation tolerance protein CutA [Acidobacteriaceae bacterium]